ncbi:AAA domain-containing protein [Geodermatophilus dictyosporus]|uniref:AAA domain-containing protein n=1 Tax=Geodermatophilus dictyosporus TaxID=1523247 RepID=A0A1I5TR40_9ACTN|nr:MobF family relaxase [Geodermatophilus dictyosporus]SFP85505.1 AAA domain-containing protein [Geodermatophilus dictyosporus]
MHGGLKIYTGAPAAARHYVEAGRGRADDYYLTEGPGIARRYTAAGGRVAELAALTGDGYETWVAGLDPDTGVARGRLRTDDRAVRFVEVVVNGPKSWSLVAALHPDVAAAYDAAQDRAATQIIGWLSRHATTRVGPRGGQVQVPVEVLEAVKVRHYTSRAGDPHRHLHLQVNARVFAAGSWRGLHTVGVRDFLAAVNGIGHAAAATDLQFRAALAAHGYTLDRTGEIQELAEYVGPFSARAAQIGRHRDRYEQEWTAAHPGKVPGPGLRRAWDARAWAEGRPDKVTPQPGADLTARWVGELAALGYRDRDRPVDLVPTPVGSIDRDDEVGTVLTRLAAGRSAWNAADVRGEVEQLIAAAGIVVDAAVRLELAEDLTARAMARCVPLLDRDGGHGAVSEHVRAWTSQPVLDVEADLTARFATRSAPSPANPRRGPEPALSLSAPAGLDPGQEAAAAALAGDRPLIVIEGAAGAGKTSLLAAARNLLAAQGRRLTVVTPTLKAAKVAAAEVGTATGSAAWLAFQHGWRWPSDGIWTRLAAGAADPLTGNVYAGPEQEGARLRMGDLLVVDEAGMLDQDTARVLLTIADEHHVRVALLGDRHQLAAVGRGGVLDLAVREVDPLGHLTLDEVHRFTRTDDTGRVLPDAAYAELTLAMRTGEDPGAMFDALVTRGQIRLHPDHGALQQALAELTAAHHRDGERVAVVVDTREQAAELGAAIRQRLVADGRVDDRAAVTTRAGQRIGAGDRIATRRNDRALKVANRDTWTVTAVGRHGELIVTPADAAPGDVTPGASTPTGAGQRVLPADYVTAHVELAYASTAHGVQGDTVPAAHTVIGEHTGAASAYVGMTRGRTTNTAHLIAEDPAEARKQWIAVFGRDRADLGPGHAAQLAAAEAAHYAAPRPLEQVLAELHQAWTAEQRCLTWLAVLQPMREALGELIGLHQDLNGQLAALTDACRQAETAARQAAGRAAVSGSRVAADADRIRDTLLGRWDTDRDSARAAATVVLGGPGQFGLRRPTLSRAAEHLTDWANRWRLHLPDLPTDPGRLAQVAGRPDNRPALQAALGAAARRTAEDAHPEHATLLAAAHAAQHAHDQARRAVAEAGRRRDQQLGRYGALGRTPDPMATLADLDRQIATAQQDLAEAHARITQLTTEPALPSQPTDRLAAERHAWRAARDADAQRLPTLPSRPNASTIGVPRPQPERLKPSVYQRATTPGLGR